MRNDEMNKWCPRCQQYLPRDEFYRNAAQSDGLAPYCKVCWREFCRVQHAVCAKDFPISGAFKWIWFVTITSVVLNTPYKHMCLDCLPRMEMWPQTVPVFNSPFMKEIGY